MRATFDWSYDLLSEREARVFRRIAVFAGGWTLAAFVDVCSDERDDEWEAVAAVAALASLVQKSLVAHDAFGTTSRYRLLESTREYTREKLVASGEADDLALRHLTSYARSIDDAGRL